MIAEYSKNPSSPYKEGPLSLPDWCDRLEPYIKRAAHNFPPNMKRYALAKSIISSMPSPMSADDELRIGFNLLIVRCKSSNSSFFSGSKVSLSHIV